MLDAQSALQADAGLVFQAHRVLDPFERTDGDLPCPILQHIVERLPRNERIDQSTIKGRSHTLERAERDRPSNLPLFELCNGWLRDSNAGTELARRHAERFPDLTYPSAFWTGRLKGLPHMSKSAIKLHSPKRAIPLLLFHSAIIGYSQRQCN